MKIAVTSQNFRTVTGHAGKTRRFLVFEGGADRQPKEMQRIDLPKGMAFHDFHDEGEHPVDVADVIITGGCGQGFVNRMAARGIRVVATSESDPVKAAAAVANGELLPPPEPHGH